MISYLSFSLIFFPKFFFSALGTPIYFSFFLDKSLWIVRVGSTSRQTITQSLRWLPSTTFVVLVSYLYFFVFNWAGIVKGGNLNFMNGPPVYDFVLFSCCVFFFFSRHFFILFLSFLRFFFFCLRRSQLGGRICHWGERTWVHSYFTVRLKRQTLVPQVNWCKSFGLKTKCWDVSGIIQWYFTSKTGSIVVTWNAVNGINTGYQEGESIILLIFCYGV